MRPSSAPPSSRAQPASSWAAVVDWEEGGSGTAGTEDLYADDMDDTEADSLEDSNDDIEGGGSDIGGGWGSRGKQGAAGRGAGNTKNKPTPSYLLPTAASTTSTRPRAHIAEVPHPRVTVTSTYTTRRAGDSSTGAQKHREQLKQLTQTRNQILADKRHWARVKNARGTAAMESIASSRVATILRATDGDEGGDSSAPRPPAMHWSSSSSSHQSHSQRTRGRSHAGAKGHYGPSSKRLSDGSSSLAIADAFLESQLGRELMASVRQTQDDRGGTSEDGDENYSPVRNFGLTGTRKQQPSYSSGDGEGDEGEEEDASGVYFASGWKGTQGGWVADFGPPHTHHLSVHNFDHPDDKKASKKVTSN
jgi:hypothetical protein